LLEKEVDRLRLEEGRDLEGKKLIFRMPFCKKKKGNPKPPAKERRLSAVRQQKKIQGSYYREKDTASAERQELPGQPKRFTDNKKKNRFYHSMNKKNIGGKKSASRSPQKIFLAGKKKKTHLCFLRGRNESKLQRQAVIIKKSFRVLRKTRVCRGKSKKMRTGTERKEEKARLTSSQPRGKSVP